MWQCHTQIRPPNSFRRCFCRFLLPAFQFFVARVHYLSSLQRNLDASSLTKDEMIDLLLKSDAITSVPDAPIGEANNASSDAPVEVAPQASEALASSAATPTTSDPKDDSLASSSVVAPVVGHVDATTGEPIRTVYVGACPSSLSERELYQVFNRFVGYESSYLYHMNGKVSAFVTFHHQNLPRMQWHFVSSTGDSL